MAEYLRISVTFLDGRFHGRRDGGVPEWPPSPLRLMQAIVAANVDRVGVDGELDAALSWLEQQSPPIIMAPSFTEGAAYCLSVPNNAMDIVGKAWARGQYFGTGDASPATHRTMKTVRPIRLLEDDTVHYLWLLRHPDEPPIDTIADATRRLVALGWGIDLAVGNANRIRSSDLNELAREQWTPTSERGRSALRVPTKGSLQAMLERHEAFVHRMTVDGFAPVPPLTRFQVVGYRRPADPVMRPVAIFELRNDDGSFFHYPQRKLIHIAGMVRHVAIETMKRSPPAGVDDDWVRAYVAGHAQPGEEQHRQFSYLPLPSVGHVHTNPAVRRVMITAPVGDDRLLEHLALRVAGRQLRPTRRTEIDDPPMLVRVLRDPVAYYYTEPCNTWASVTPVILPGHDDHKPAKTRRLIEKALAQSGIDQPCEFQWSPFSHWPKSLSAHKYDRDGRPQGYIRPSYLLSQTAVHLKLRFKDGFKMPGPLAVGAGRHCGLGLLARVDDGATQW